MIAACRQARIPRRPAADSPDGQGHQRPRGPRALPWPLLRAQPPASGRTPAAGWDQRATAPGPPHLAPLAAALLHVRPEPERALDIGTGLGDGALLIAREFPRARVRGVDLSEEMVRRAQRRIGLDPEGRVAFQVADAADLPFEDESFDLVAQLNMPPFFAEIARVLRPGGFAIVAASWGAADALLHARLGARARLPQGRPRRGGERRGGRRHLLRCPAPLLTPPATRFTGSAPTAATCSSSTRTPRAARPEAPARGGAGAREPRGRYRVVRHARASSTASRRPGGAADGARSPW